MARELLGCVLLREIDGTLAGGPIVETEAYLPSGDPANHAYRGRSARNASMFAIGGTAYVYTIHARYCLNAVTGPADEPAAVLIRAIEPRWGLEAMRRRRGRERDLTRGPARLCEALGIDLGFDGWDLTQGRSLWIGPAIEPIDPRRIIATPRVGIRRAADLPLRFLLADSPFVSKPNHGRRAKSEVRRAKGAWGTAAPGCHQCGGGAATFGGARGHKVTKSQGHKHRPSALHRCPVPRRGVIR